MKNFQVRILMMVVQMVLSRLSPNLLKSFADSALDKLEDLVKESATELDDQIILPLIALVRAAFDVPDNDDEDGGDDNEPPEFPTELS